MYKLICLLFLCSVCVDSKFCTEKRRLYSPEGYDWDQHYYSHVKEVTVKFCCHGYQETAVSASLRLFDEFKDDIECEPICNPPCENGHCTAPSQCTCLSGYELIDGTCNPICSEPCLHGECVSPEWCICHYGYRKFESNVCEACADSKCLSKNADDSVEVETIEFVSVVEYNIVNMLLPLCFMMTALVLLFFLMHWTPVEVNVVEKEEKYANYLQMEAMSDVSELPDKETLIIE